MDGEEVNAEKCFVVSYQLMMGIFGYATNVTGAIDYWEIVGVEGKWEEFSEEGFVGTKGTTVKRESTKLSATGYESIIKHHLDKA